MRCPAGITAVVGTSRVEAVVLDDDGDRLDAEVLLVARCCAVPETEWLDGLGLDTAGVVLCDDWAGSALAG